MHNFYKAHISRIFNSLEFRITLCYLFLGTIFTIFSYSGNSYFQILLNQLIEPRYLCLFVYPSFIIMFYLNFKYIKLDTNLILRLKNRKEYVKVHFISMLLCTFIFYLQLILVLLIFCTILYDGSYGITMTFGYKIPGVFLLIFTLIKVFCTILTLGLINITFMLLLKKQSNAFIILSIVLGIIFLGNKIYTDNVIIDFFNIAFHSHGLTDTTNVSYLIISDALYFGLIGILLRVYCNRCCNKARIGMNL